MPGYRREKIASLIRGIVGEAIIPKLHDPRVSPFTSVTRVEVARDLSVAKIGISVAGEKSDERRTMAAIHHATGHLQRMVAEALNTRVCPKLRFAIDDSVKGVREIMKILDENRREMEQRDAAQPHETDDGTADTDKPGRVDSPPHEREEDGEPSV